MTDIKTAPQAYTRETLSQAFLWLRSQPQEIKDRAKNPDALVSLYLHAVRHGLDVFKTDLETEAPRSTQDFKKTLADLSKGMLEFDDGKKAQQQAPQAPVQQQPAPRSQQAPQAQQAPPRTTRPPQQQTPTAPPVEAARISQPAPAPQMAPPQNPAPQPPPVAQVAYPQPGNYSEPSPAYRAYFYDEDHYLTEGSFPPPQQQAPAPRPQQPLQLDGRSYEAIRRVQARMNLSSESEALRMLVSLGYDRLRNILP